MNIIYKWKAMERIYIYIYIYMCVCVFSPELLERAMEREICENMGKSINIIYHWRF